ncbi:MAG: hypothetical protein WBO19_08015, partial [Terriglobia bacterium]
VDNTRKMAVLRENGGSPPAILSQLLAPWAKFFRPSGPSPLRTSTFRSVQHIKKNALASTSASRTPDQAST